MAPGDPQSNQRGIETDRGRYCDDDREDLNRTSVGLKQILRFPETQTNNNLNRTSVGLKRWT